MERLPQSPLATRRPRRHGPATQPGSAGRARPHARPRTASSVLVATGATPRAVRPWWMRIAAQRRPGPVHPPPT